MSLTGITGTGLAAYVASALSAAEQKTATADGTTTTTGSTATTATTASRGTSAASSALDAISHSRKSVAAQTVLAKQQTQLTADIQAALAKAGLKLTGELSFSVDASGAGQVNGSQEDRTTIASLLKADTSKPGLTQRVTGLVQSAAKLSASMRDNAAWVQAARSAGRNGNVLDLYSVFSQNQDTTATTYRLDATSGSLSYAGIVSSKA